MKSSAEPEPEPEPDPEPPAPRRSPVISRKTLAGLARQAPAASPDKVRRLRGVVRSGVERNSCVLLGPQGEPLAQLMGGPPAVLSDGKSVVVTGVFVPGLLTTAQQGAPFRVQTAEPDEQAG